MFLLTLLRSQELTCLLPSRTQCRFGNLFVKRLASSNPRVLVETRCLQIKGAAVGAKGRQDAFAYQGITLCTKDTHTPRTRLASRKSLSVSTL
jgi:hypothetical protein